MEFRTLGRTGLKVSSICHGTMNMGEQNTETEGHEQMDYALERGINFFDTAELYPVPPKAETVGRTEKIIGSWFSAHKNRDKVVLATNIAETSLTIPGVGAVVDSGLVRQMRVSAATGLPVAVEKMDRS